jgi:hypothetical protein
MLRRKLVVIPEREAKRYLLQRVLRAIDTSMKDQTVFSSNIRPVICCG